MCDLATLFLTPISVDLDIDSDNYNNSYFSFGTYVQPERSEREELYENHLYGFGKLMIPNWNDADEDGVLDCWDGYSIGSYNQQGTNCSELFYPIVLELPEYVSLDEPCIQLFYSMASTIPNVATGVRPTSGDGTIRIWKKNGYEARNGLSVTNNGDLVSSSSDNVYYTPRQLGFNALSRTAVLYVEPVTENSVDSDIVSNWKYVNQYLANGQDIKPTTSIRVKLSLGGISVED